MTNEAGYTCTELGIAHDGNWLNAQTISLAIKGVQVFTYKEQFAGDHSKPPRTKYSIQPDIFSLSDLGEYSVATRRS